MILVADSGSTKTDWRLVREDGEKVSFSTIGFNPYFITSEQVINELLNSDLFKIKEDVSSVYFYGSGCSSVENNKVLHEAMASFFGKAEVYIDHDMLAAARALCGNKRGMVAILGTGSNSCLYDGNKIVENVTSLGFILGDYGSGVDIGKALIKAYFGEELSSDIKKDFIHKYNLSTNDILDAVYKKPLPNRFLAGFSLFVYQHREDPFIKKMLEKRLDIFFLKNICKYSDYKNYQLNLVGSIAFFYQNLIREVAKNYQVEIGSIIKQPIDNLVNYHLK